MYHVVCGTYESPLYGFIAHTNVDKEKDNIPPNKEGYDEDVVGGVILEQLFAYAPHTASIRAAAAAGEWLVTSSTDESLKVYDMTTKRELGTITRSEGMVTCLEFYGSTHLFCGTERGDILAWKSHHWEQLPSLKGHTDRVNSVSVHPSGALALSVSKDKTLKLWDLSKGIVAHTNKLEHEADHVKWSPDGEHYIVVSDKRIVLYSSLGKKLRTMSEFKRINAVVWLDKGHFATGGEDRKICIFELHADLPIRTITGFKNRIKGLATMPKDSDSQFPYIVSVSSDERIRVWDPNSTASAPVCSVYQDVRLICLAVAPVPIKPDTSSKKKQNKDRKTDIGELLDSEDDAATPAPIAANPKKFKVIEYREQDPIRKHAPATASSAAPAKSILKKSSTSPAPAPAAPEPKSTSTSKSSKFSSLTDADLPKARPAPSADRSVLNRKKAGKQAMKALLK
jgi:protein MAK11